MATEPRGIPLPEGYRRIPPRLNLAHEVLYRQLESGCGPRLALVAPQARLTYEALAARVDAFAAGCLQQGLARGDRVLIRMWNCVEYAVAFLALTKIGAVAVMQNSIADVTDVSYVLEHSDSVAAITLNELAAPLRELRDRLHKGLIVARGHVPGEIEFESLTSARVPAAAPADTAADEPALMCYTSGTTGKPKGIVHAHRWIIALGDPNRLRVPPEPNDVIMAAGEWSFISALGHNVLFALRNGVTGAILEGRANPGRFLQAIADYKVTVTYAVPTIYRRTLAVPDVEKNYDLSSLRGCNANGEALEAATYHAWKQRFGVDIWEHYGVSEMQMIIGQSPRLPLKPGSTGVPWGVEAAVVDSDHRRLPVGEIGQLVIGSDNPSMFLGYHKNPEKTAEVVHDGWYHTGDLAWQDEDGYFWIAGRNDDCFKSRGVFIAPIEIENALREHPEIAEACVVPVRDERDGNLIRAFIVTRTPVADRGEFVDELRAMLRNKLARNKIPHAFEFMDALPKSAIGKVLRRQLAEQAATG